MSAWSLIVYVTAFDPNGANVGDIFGAYREKTECVAHASQLLPYFGRLRVRCLYEADLAPVGAICQPHYPPKVATLPPCVAATRPNYGLTIIY